MIGAGGGTAGGGPRSRARPLRLLVTLLSLAAVVALALVYWSPARAAVRRALDARILERVEGHAAEIRSAAREFDVDPHLIAAMIYCESSGRVGAVSRTGALGLMQLMPDAVEDGARALGIETPDRERLLSDAALNIRLGARHFAWTRANEEHDSERALVAYNVGRTTLRRWMRESGGYTPWREERLRAGDSGVLDYAQRVLRYRDTFRERGVIAADVNDDPGSDDASDS